jgi:pimeloyl-ACP methyl ester carboxylesterase
MRIHKRQTKSLLFVHATVLCVLLSACAQRSLQQLNEQVLIGVEDTELYAEVRGNDEDAPLILYLHGGPGSPLGVPVFRAYGGRLLEDHFVVVYLHQRGIMKSPRVTDNGHRVQKYVEDVHYVVEHLRREFPDRELSLLGHSWGGVLAYLYLSNHQDGIHKLVTVSTPINVESMIYGRVDMILEWARDTGNQEAIQDLSPLADKSVLDHAEDFKILAKWSRRAYGGWARKLSRDRIDASVDYEDLIPVWLKEQEHIEQILLMELLRLDLRSTIEKIDIPLLCIVGKDDVDTPWYIVQEEIKSYGGSVDLQIFDNSHHMPFIDEEDLFAATVVQFLGRPPAN